MLDSADCKSSNSIRLITLILCLLEMSGMRERHLTVTKRTCFVRNHACAGYDHASCVGRIPHTCSTVHTAMNRRSMLKQEKWAKKQMGQK
jgi:hypothetical protein